MIRGLYSAAANLVAQMVRQEVISTNLANVNTVGYKRDVVPLKRSVEVGVPADFKSLLDGLQLAGPSYGEIGRVGTGVLSDPVTTHFEQGELRVSDRPLDLALVGEGFFSLMTPEGDIVYTRAGDFVRSADGQLVSSDGLPALGYDGPIAIGEGSFDVDPGGSIYQNGQLVGRLLIVNFDDTSKIRKVGGNIFAPMDKDTLPNPVSGSIVRQRALELSNVNPTQAMVDLISALRSFEASQRIMQLQDQMLDRAVNEIGRV